MSDIFYADVLSLDLAIYAHRLYGTLSFAVEQALGCEKLAKAKLESEVAAHRIGLGCRPNRCQQGHGGSLGFDLPNPANDSTIAALVKDT